MLLCEAVVFGRAAMGEAVEQGALIDRWRLRRDGKLVFAENVRLDGAIARNTVADGHRPTAPSRLQRYSSLRAMKATAPPCANCEPEFAGEVGVSAWNGIAVARFCARDGAALAARSHRSAGSAQARRAAAPLVELAHEPDAARKGQAADRDGRDGGAPPARARRQAQSSGSGRADHRFHHGRRARRPHRRRADGRRRACPDGATR